MTRLVKVAPTVALNLKTNGLHYRAGEGLLKICHCCLMAQQQLFLLDKSTMKFFRFCFLSFAFLALSCTNNLQAQPQELRVLFIGNSLTYANELPAMIAALAENSKQKLTYKTLAYPDFGLQDHWERGDAQKEIAKGKWDVVILQQGPSALPESRQLLLEYVRRFAKEIRAAGAKPALYMVWSSITRFNDFPRVMESYKLAAEEINAMLLPVGAAWRAAWKPDAKFALYAHDKFHPSVLGSYLAALVIYKKLFGKAPAEIPVSLKLRAKALAKIKVSQEQNQLLQAAANEANKNF